ncbi:hypothetical protein SAMN02745181_1260 [Rubritalea squalenifaciens DSM 18772]|uniref:Apea-like HEPN domain-containing protein n=1 Tax=Rubritalea squalenifaciens DSM 18772 TaxID=1123071 RepID=A0A1M6GTF9_9BACT|nr:hypothetical protein [Rubritalea squalenifaciens]SHJ13149.1 hypothetical protein SAMN02745181_1260 [Rubritalea squalenifaciens DSM 18772]
MTPPDFDLNESLKKISYEHTDFDSKEIQHVLEFTLMWNIFEKRTCGNHVNLKKLKEHVHQSYTRGLVEVDDFQDHLNYLRSLYSNSNSAIDLESTFLPDSGNLKKREQPEIEALSLVLKEETQEELLILTSLLFVTYRVRNNLFHGAKEVGRLREQQGLFQTVNSILAVYLEKAT